ncbi:hypothetical protein B4N84_00650, partial [Flavobacterium sp. IR1]
MARATGAIMPGNITYKQEIDQIVAKTDAIRGERRNSGWERRNDRRERRIIVEQGGNKGCNR